LLGISDGKTYHADIRSGFAVEEIRAGNRPEPNPMTEFRCPPSPCRPVPGRSAFRNAIIGRRIELPERTRSSAITAVSSATPPGRETMKQLSLFDRLLLREIHLIASSPRNAFYRMRLEQIPGRYQVRKYSGTGSRVMDARSWEFSSLADAEKFYDRTIRNKTNPIRNSPRKYRIFMELD
jgi:hypothetical protein